MVGGVSLGSNVLMAPLAGYTCFPFRLMAVRLGAGSAYTEMVSSDAIKYNDRATSKLLYTDDREKLKCGRHVYIPEEIDRVYQLLRSYTE